MASGEIWRRGRDREFFGLKDVTPGVPADPSGMHQGAFGKRGCKVLKTKDVSEKKSAKRLQVIEGLKVRAGVTEGVREVPSKEHT